MNGHDDDELDIYGPQDGDEGQQQQADDDRTLADYYETLRWFSGRYRK
ncbi:MAG: hypothetical protein IPM49_18340 [Flavobacteriales bacterium]|nr:hypothetical protein [Flavobacteriales bacterium]